MGKFKDITFLKRIVVNIPILLLFISVLNEFDFNYLEIKFFAFNFPFILIFYWSLKKTEVLGYGFIFIAGLINDVVIGYNLTTKFVKRLVIFFIYNLSNKFTNVFTISLIFWFWT